MKFKSIPLEGPIRRGVLTRMVFAAADKAIATRHRSIDGTEDSCAIRIVDACLLFNTHKRVKMSRQYKHGPAVFVVGDAYGYTRITLWGLY